LRFTSCTTISAAFTKDYALRLQWKLELQIMFGLLRNWSLYWTEVIGLPPNLSALLLRYTSILVGNGKESQMSAGRQISNAEAGLIISGWHDSGVVIKSQCEIEPVAFSFRGRIVEFSDSRRVRFLNVDGRAEFAFDIGDDFDCWYLEPRDFPEDARFHCPVRTRLAI
jgi:hypothetical protein